MSATLGASILLDASLLLVATGSYEGLKICDDDYKIKEGKLCFKLEAKGSVTVFSFLEKEINYPLIKQKCIE